MPRVLFTPSCVVLVLSFLAQLPAGVSARTLEARLDYSVSDLEAREAAAGLSPELLDVSDGKGGVLPMDVRVFYVPVGWEVAATRAVALDEVPVNRTRLRMSSEATAGDEDVRPLPAAALATSVDGVSATYPVRPAVSLSSGSLGGHRLHLVAVFPVRRDTATDELRLSRSVAVELELRPARPASDLVRQRSSAAADRAYREAIVALVENVMDVPGPIAGHDAPTRDADVDADADGFAPREIPSVEGSAVDMVIVTTSELESTFQTLADWKTKKGVPSVVRTTDWIDANYPAGHDPPERVRLFLRDAYSKWGSFLVLIGGDGEEVTPRRAFSRFFFGGVSPESDQYFACLEGNWNGDGDDKFAEGEFLGDPGDGADILPDVFIGRAPVTSVAEASTFVSKSLTYDKTPPAGYTEDACILAEVLFPNDWEFGDDPAQITLDGKELADGLESIIPPSWTRTLLYQSEGNLSRASALAELNLGHHLVMHSGHGDATKFSVGDGPNPFIYVEDGETVANGDRLMFMTFNLGSSNAFSADSFGKALMNNPGGGAIAIYGATTIDFPLASWEHQKRLFELFFTHGVTRFGVATQLNRVPFAPLSATDSTPDRWEVLYRHLYGDPELRFWTVEPGSFQVSHAAAVAFGTASITITVTDALAAPVGDALVCASDANGTYSRARTDASGMVTLPLTSVSPGAVDLVVTKAEFLPHEGTFVIDPVAGASLALSDHLFDDDGDGISKGNGDGVVDAGEIVELDVTALNGGGSSADAAFVAASVEAGTSATFDLLYDGVADASRIHVGPGRANPPSVPFTLDFAAPSIPYIGAPFVTASPDSVADTGIFVWQDDQGWHILWSSGPDAVTVSGSVTTDGRVREHATLELEESDTAVLAVGENVLTFSGTTGPSDPVDAIDLALADDTMITILTASDALGDVSAATSGEATVVFEVASAARGGQLAWVDLSFTSTTGGPWSSVVPIVFAGPALEAFVLAVDDSNVPPLSGNANGIVEVGETVRLTPTVLNRGSGAAVGVDGTATASGGITFLDPEDSYGEISRLSESAGTDGYVFTVDDGTGTSFTLTLIDGVGRSWEKTIDFVAPPVPVSLAFSPGPSSITFTWADADTNGSPDLAGYNVYRSETSSSGFERLSFELLRAGTRFVDEDIPGTTFYYRVTAVDTSGNESAPTPELFAWTTHAQVPGWPRTTGSWNFSSIGISDVDGVGPASELFLGSHDFHLHGWNATGTVAGGFPVATGGEVWSTPALVDLDDDGDEEILWGSNDERFYAVHHDGSPVFGATPDFVDLSGTGSLIRTAATVADIDQDAKLEILFGTDAGTIYGFNDDGTGMGDGSGLLFSVGGGSSNRIWRSLAIADLEGDGVREIAFGSWNGSLYVIHSDGSLVAGFPRGPSGGVVGNDFKGGPVAGDLDGDGTMEIVVGNFNGNLYVFDHDGGDYRGNPDGVLAWLGGEVEIHATPALANLDGDPELEILLGASNSTMYVFNHDGTGFLVPDGTFADVGSDKLSSSPIVVDVDGDNELEILFGGSNGNFYAYELDGSLMVGFPIPTEGAIFSTPAAGDIDGDGDVDVAFASYDRSVNVIDFPGASYAGAYEWPTLAGNNWRSGAYEELGPFQTGVDPLPAGPTLVFSLGQNTPNPFFGATSIRYVVPRHMNVSLRVYDVSGRLIRTLAQGPVPAGARTVIWDGRDTHGERVSSGVYFYRLDSGAEALSRKGVVLR